MGERIGVVGAARTVELFLDGSDFEYPKSSIAGWTGDNSKVEVDEYIGARIGAGIGFASMVAL